MEVRSKYESALILDKIEIIENNNIEANSHEQEEPCDCYKFIEH